MRLVGQCISEKERKNKWHYRGEERMLTMGLNIRRGVRRHDGDGEGTSDGGL